LPFFVENLDKLEFKDDQEKGKEKAKVTGFVFFSGNKSVLSQQLSRFASLERITVREHSSREEVLFTLCVSMPGKVRIFLSVKQQRCI